MVFSATWQEEDLGCGRRSLVYTSRDPASYEVSMKNGTAVLISSRDSKYKGFPAAWQGAN